MNYLRATPFFLLFLLYYPFIVLLFLILHFSGFYSWRETFKKLGFLKLDPLVVNKEVTWFHISSLGEYNGLKFFLKKYIEKKGGSVVISYFNPDVIQVLEKEKLQATYFALPFENPPTLAKILKSFSIDKIFFYENEFWPITLLFLRSQNCNLYLLNGFIQDKEYRNMLFSYPVFTIVLKVFKQLFIVSDKHKKRFVKLGVKREKIKIVGNLKYDFLQEKTKAPLTKEFLFGEDAKRVLLLVSIHPKEWDLLKKAVENLVKKNIKIIVAPRMLESVRVVKSFLEEKGVAYSLMTNPSKADAFIVDAFGEMSRIYGAADLCFVGGSIIPYGGHNFLEPISHNVKTVFGNHMEHYADALDLFKNFTHFVDEKNFEETVLNLIEKNEGDHGISLLKSIQGVSETILRELP